MHNISTVVEGPPRFKAATESSFAFHLMNWLKLNIFAYYQNLWNDKNDALDSLESNKCKSPLFARTKKVFIHSISSGNIKKTKNKASLIF